MVASTFFSDNFSVSRRGFLVRSSFKRYFGCFTLQSWSISRQASINRNISSSDHSVLALMVPLDFGLPRGLLWSLLDSLVYFPDSSISRSVVFGA